MRNDRAWPQEAENVAAGPLRNPMAVPRPGANLSTTLAHNASLSKSRALDEPTMLRLGDWYCLGDVIRDPDRAAFALSIMPRLGLDPLQALLAFRALTQEDAVVAVARQLGLAVAQRPLSMMPGHGSVLAQSNGITMALDGSDPVVVVDALRQPPRVIQNLVATSGWPPTRVVLATSTQWYDALSRVRPEDIMHRAVTGLQTHAPELAAVTPPPAWQLERLSILPGLIIGAAIVAPEGLLAAVAALLTLPFLCVAALRLAALREALRPRRRRSSSTSPIIADAGLPMYSVLVPLYREANVLPGLVDALGALDYPADKLDVILILEGDDVETRRAAELIALPACIRVVLVPPGEPRTKPRALNYALHLAAGELVAVFDAEDIPEPDQLRRAAAMFREAPPTLACVQGRLNIDNAYAGWLEQQFTIEYTALFDAILPTLHNLDVPIPLGGTSNHFPAALLRAIGGWDPHNVTEDADLGIRLARAGLETRILASTTWEEAPARLGSWYRQRTRWLKGWMQTNDFGEQQLP